MSKSVQLLSTTNRRDVEEVIGCAEREEQQLIVRRVQWLLEADSARVVTGNKYVTFSSFKYLDGPEITFTLDLCVTLSEVCANLIRLDKKGNGQWMSGRPESVAFEANKAVGDTPLESLAQLLHTSEPGPFTLESHDSDAIIIRGPQGLIEFPTDRDDLARMLKDKMNQAYLSGKNERS